MKILARQSTLVSKAVCAGICLAAFGLFWEVMDGVHRQTDRYLDLEAQARDGIDLSGLRMARLNQLVADRLQEEEETARRLELRANQAEAAAARFQTELRHRQELRRINLEIAKLRIQQGEGSEAEIAGNPAN